MCYVLCCTCDKYSNSDKGQHCLPDQPACWPLVKRMRSRLIRSQDAKDDEEKIVYPKDFFNNVYDAMLSRIGTLWEDYQATKGKK